MKTVGDILSLLPGSSNLPSSEVLQNHHREAKDLFCNAYYISVGEFFVESFTSDCLQGVEPTHSSGHRVDMMISGFFLKGPPEEAFLVLSHAVGTIKESFKLYFIILLLKTLIQQNCLQRVFTDYAIQTKLTPCRNSESKMENQLQWSALLTAIASLPDVVTPKLGSKYELDFFYPQNYIPFITMEIVTTLKTVYTQMQNGHDCSVAILSAVVGKLAMTGHGRVVWKRLLEEMESLCLCDFLWQRIFQKMIEEVDDRSIEQVVLPLISQASSHLLIKSVLGSLPLQRTRLDFILTHKLLLVRYSEDVHQLQNVLGYMVSVDELKPMFIKTVIELLNAWSDVSSLRHRSIEQSLYICKAIMISMVLISSKVLLLTNNLKEMIQKCLLNGVTAYLDSSIQQIRQMGMVVAETISGVIHTDDGKRLKFEMEKNEMIDSLLELLNISPFFDDRKSVEEKESLEDEMKKSGEMKKSDEMKQERETTDKNLNTNDETTKSEIALDSDDDDDDELKPLRGGEGSKGKRRPTYLLECMDGLLKSNDPELFEECLSHAQELIQKHPEVHEISVEMCQILLHLEDHYSLPHFILHRHKAMVALVVSSPEDVARYLIQQFYERNYNVRQRLDILDVLSSAVRELSKPHQHQQILEEKRGHHSSIVETRLESKTRRFVKGPTRLPLTSAPNRLISVIGWFFYPLMNEFDKKLSCLDLLGSDHMILERLLQTLGVIIFSSSNLPNVLEMAKALVDFTRFFRYHSQSSVRRAVIYAQIMIVMAVPSFYLLSDLEREVMELREWVEEMLIRNETDVECRKLAVQLLIVLKSQTEK